MTDQGKKYLTDILQAINLIESFTSGIADYDDYINDLKTQSAVERQLGIIGELVVLRPPQTVLLTHAHRSKRQSIHFIPKYSEAGQKPNNGIKAITSSPLLPVSPSAPSLLALGKIGCR